MNAIHYLFNPLFSNPLPPQESKNTYLGASIAIGILSFGSLHALYFGVKLVKKVSILVFTTFSPAAKSDRLWKDLHFELTAHLNYLKWDEMTRTEPFPITSFALRERTILLKALSGHRSTRTKFKQNFDQFFITPSTTDRSDLVFTQSDGMYGNFYSSGKSGLAKLNPAQRKRQLVIFIPISEKASNRLNQDYFFGLVHEQQQLVNIPIKSLSYQDYQTMRWKEVLPKNVEDFFMACTHSNNQEQDFLLDALAKDFGLYYTDESNRKHADYLNWKEKIKTCNSI